MKEIPPDRRYTGRGPSIKLLHQDTKVSVENLLLSKKTDKFRKCAKDPMSTV